MKRIKPPALKINAPTSADDEMSYSWNSKLSGEVLKKFLKIRGNKKNSEAVRAIVMDFYNKLPADKRTEYMRIFKDAYTKANIDISVYDGVLKNI